MANSRPLTPLGRCVIFGAIALFALGFVLEGIRTLDRGYFAYRHAPLGSRPYTVRYTIGKPHAPLIAWGCIAVATTILLWGLVIVAPSTRATPRRRAAFSLASGGLLGAAVLLWLPPWRLWPSSPLLLAYALPAVLALLWRVTRTRDPIDQEIRRTRVVLAVLATVGGLWYWKGAAVLGGAAAGAALVFLWIAHRRFALSHA